MEERDTPTREEERDTIPEEERYTIPREEYERREAEIKAGKGKKQAQGFVTKDENGNWVEDPSVWDPTRNTYVTKSYYDKNVLPKLQAKQAEFDRIQGLKDELSSLSEKARSKEDEMRGLLVRSTGESQEAVDKLLANLIDQTGYTAGLSKQAVAAQQASQGILRSGVTGSRLRTIDENRATAVTGLTGDAETQKQAIRDTATRSLQGVEDRRREIETQFKVMELKGLEDLEYQSKAQDIKMQFEQYINDLNISSQEKLAMLNAVGTIGQGIGMGIGYYAGKKAETPDAK
jgi:hypothetical protein